MYPWLEKWLPIFFGCHCRPDRSFYFRGRKFPICARCTGELVGMLLLAFSWAFTHAGVFASLLMCVPLVADGMLQLLTAYESKNRRRFWTGILFGYGFMNLVLISLAAAYFCGVRFGLKLRG